MLGTFWRINREVKFAEVIDTLKQFCLEIIDSSFPSGTVHCVLLANEGKVV